MAQKANSIQNLKPFKKGQSGNPAGRPVKLPDIDEIISRVLNEKLSNKLTLAENIFRKMAIKAMTSERAFKLIFDRTYGKVKTSSDVNLILEKMTDSQLDLIVERILKGNENVKDGETTQ